MTAKTEDAMQVPVGRGSLGRRTQVVDDLRARHSWSAAAALHSAKLVRGASKGSPAARSQAWAAPRR